MGKTRNLDFGLKANLGGLGKQLGFLFGVGFAASLVEELTPDFIKDFAAYLSTDRGLANGTIWQRCMWLKGV